MEQHNPAAVVVADSLVEVRRRWLVHTGSKPVLVQVKQRSWMWLVQVWQLESRLVDNLVQVENEMSFSNSRAEQLYELVPLSVMQASLCFWLPQPQGSV